MTLLIGGSLKLSRGKLVRNLVLLAQNFFELAEELLVTRYVHF